MTKARETTPPTVPTIKARQGLTPGTVRYVLAASLALVIIGLGVAWLLV